MPDISETRWCEHGKRYDDYCADCEVAELQTEVERLGVMREALRNLVNAENSVTVFESDEAGMSLISMADCNLVDQAVERAEQALQVGVALRCPACDGPPDNGHDREYPPNAYRCIKCGMDEIGP